MEKQKNRYSYRWIKSCAPKPRYFRFKKILTGEIIEGVNLSKWCREQGMKKFAHQDFSYLLNGSRKQVYGFCLPKSNIKPFVIKNLISGLIYKDLTILGLSRQIGIHQEKLSDLFNHKRERVNEWARPDFNIKSVDKLPLLRNNKTGEEHRLFNNFNWFCRQRDFSGSIQTVLKSRGFYKDWEWVNKPNKKFRFKIKDLVTGELFKINRLDRFCEERKIDVRQFYYFSKKNSPRYKFA